MNSEEFSYSEQFPQLKIKLSLMVLLMSTHLIWYHLSQSSVSQPIILSKMFGNLQEVQSASIK